MSDLRFYVVDDDVAVRSMIAEIIEDNDLGEVVGTAENGSVIDLDLLMRKRVDILIIDLLMPIRDGLQTLRELDSGFEGKIIMISQIESKEMIGEAYGLGVEYYITKPVNRLEVMGVVRKVSEHLQLRRSIRAIQKTLNIFDDGDEKSKETKRSASQNIVNSGQYLLMELGIAGESGSRDLLDMLSCLQQMGIDDMLESEFPALKDVFEAAAVRRLGASARPEDVKKEIKAAEQRVRRAVSQAVNHLASLGLTDYANPKFEEYASGFFNFAEIRKRMLELQCGVDSNMSQTTINTKKFVRVLYLEAQKRLGN